MKSQTIKKFLLSLILCLALVTSAYAASADVKMSYEGSIKENENFTVTVKYSGTTFSRVNGNLTYDTDMVEYISGGSSTGNGGYVHLKESGDVNGNLVFTLKFRALKQGSTDLKVETREIYDMDEVSLNTPSTKSTINISKSDKVVEPVDEDTNADEDVITKDVDESIGDKVEDKITSPNYTLIFFGGIIAVLALLLGVIVLITKRRR